MKILLVLLLIIPALIISTRVVAQPKPEYLCVSYKNSEGAWTHSYARTGYDDGKQVCINTIKSGAIVGLTLNDGYTITNDTTLNMNCEVTDRDPCKFGSPYAFTKPRAEYHYATE